MISDTDPLMGTGFCDSYCMPVAWLPQVIGNGSSVYNSLQPRFDPRHPHTRKFEVIRSERWVTIHCSLGLISGIHILDGFRSLGQRGGFS